ncbi:hypothetical protein PVL29_005915 [Vitis rotundifolia]|uniref:non-specific serine/threonine protein kinase n=1 Tax=Vitis rotundifolia TaxID=103349 RepID=A0AA39A3T1_VITRO|nr:hypothetical protein PVL29_005915 [Vitis rotundifolia]
MDCVTELEPDYSEFVEVDPTGRYGRYNEILGKGASKTVYRAFDEYEGIEVAWNQVKLNDFLQSPEELERLYCEIHLLKTLKHNNIMKFYTSWVDPENRNINFVTEMFTSGTLRQYRLKHRRVNIRAVKHWCRQILWGLLYLHNHKPPVIHRDLKCDNIFVNGNQGEVKIGDLGLAAILRKSHAAHCVGTPEFMAPEVYEEEYNELVDIYSFGMCILEMVTFEYPYSECTHPAQIYKKVISGKKPDALYKVKDPEVRQFIEKCLATVTLRLSARELLKDPFLQSDDYGSDLRPIEYQRDLGEVGPLPRLPHYDIHHSYSSLMNGYSGYPDFELENRLDCHPVEFERNEIDLFTYQEDEHLENVDISIEGRKRDDHGIFLRLRISDKEGRFRNIYFPFDMETDTALSVAMEMVSELDITDQDVTKIADMIDDEIASLVPGWKMGLGIEESQNYGHGASFCHHCASNGSPLDYVSPNNPGTKNLEVLQCSRQGCAAVHGRFEEITYRVEGSEQCVTEGAPVVSSQSDGMLYADIWAQREGPELSSEGSREIHSDEEHESLDKSIYGKEERVINIDNQSESNARNSFAPLDDYENEIRQELRWLKAKYQMQLRELRDQQLGAKPKLLSLTPNSDSMEHSRDNKGWANLAYRRPHNREPVSESCSPDDMVTAKSFFTGTLLPQSLHRATSLPVDAVDF